MEALKRGNIVGVIRVVTRRLYPVAVVMKGDEIREVSISFWACSTRFRSRRMRKKNRRRQNTPPTMRPAMTAGCVCV